MKVLNQDEVGNSRASLSFVHAFARSFRHWRVLTQTFALHVLFTLAHSFCNFGADTLSFVGEVSSSYPACCVFTPCLACCVFTPSPFGSYLTGTCWLFSPCNEMLPPCTKMPRQMPKGSAIWERNESDFPLQGMDVAIDHRKSHRDGGCVAIHT